MPAMTEAWVNERGVLVVPLTPHTCNEYQPACLACEEMVAYWASFDAPAVPVPKPEGWDEAHDASLLGADGEDAPEVLL